MRHVTILCCLTLAINVFAQYSNNANYDTRQWQAVNQQAMQQLVNGPADQWVGFTPVKVGSEFTFDRSRTLGYPYFDFVLHFDKLVHAVLFSRNSAREDYYILFDNILNVSKGAGQSEVFMLCQMSPTQFYDVVYNVETHQAKRVDTAATGLLRRFENKTPHTFYTSSDSRDKKKTQPWHDLFKALCSGDYVGGQNQCQKIIKKANQEAGINDDRLHWEAPGIFDAYPLMELAQAMLMSYPADYSGRRSMSTPCDPIQGYQYIKQIFRRTADADDPYLKYPNAILGQSDVRSSVDNIKSTIEQHMLDYARSAKTIEAYDRVILALAFCNVGLSNKARQEQERLAYSSLVSSGLTIQSCEDYLRKYDGLGQSLDHYQEIETKLAELAYEQMPHTLAGCRDFLARYEGSEYADKVRGQLSEYAFAELDTTAAACKAYLDEFHASSHNDEVWFRLYEYAFNELGDSIEACEQYLVDYPGSKYCDKVRSKIIKIKYDRACAEDTWEAYDAFLKETSYNTYTDDVKTRRDAIAHAASSSDVVREETPVKQNPTHRRTTPTTTSSRNQKSEKIVQPKPSNQSGKKTDRNAISKKSDLD